MEDRSNELGASDPEPSDYANRNPSPPPSEDGTPAGDSIGSTVYSKHWFFSTLTKLIEAVTRKEERKDKEGEEAPAELDEDMENDICKVWDMSMNEEVSLFLKEFNAPEIFLGVINKSKSNRLTEICVGILANMSCFQETCTAISDNENLGELLLLLLADPDPPTLLETCRLLLTCLSQADVASSWLERIRKHSSVRENLCFIMSSSTNVDLLVKVGELVDKIFDMDEDLMTDWIEAGSPEPQTPVTDIEEDKAPALEMVSCLLEAAKQLRYESTEGLDVYMHVLQLLTTVDAGLQAIVRSPDRGRSAWEFLYELISRDLCQPDDPPLIVQEQKTILSSVFAVMSIIFASQADQEYRKIEKNFFLIDSLLRVLENLGACHTTRSDKCRRRGSDEPPGASDEDLHLQILKDVCCEFLSNVLSELTKESILEGIKQGHINEHKCRRALADLLPLYAAYVKSFMGILSEADRPLADTLTEQIPALRDQ
ncbi:protein SAAL1 [Spea bombifrons]|uniref:protein SAAL1 n=1 Tax=Spea bombifrons TaxID=233779 RepID=UPI00234AC822|nr:protein SAAL1 [Spea bombifrons]